MMLELALIDSHAHVQFPAYDDDREAVISRARESGVGIVSVGTQYATSKAAVAVAEEHPEILWATVGFHPNHTDIHSHHDPMELSEKSPEVFSYDEFKRLAEHPKAIAIGECGLDYYRLDPTNENQKNNQRDIFLQQIELAREVKKPLVIHCRRAFDDLIHVLSREQLSLTKEGNGVVHFFSGTWEHAKRLIDLGFFLGFGGVITFARDYDDPMTKAPLDRILLETDAPYVSPVPHRGTRNEPVYIIETARKIADIRKISYDEVSRQTCKNTRKLFSLSQ